MAAGAGSPAVSDPSDGESSDPPTEVRPAPDLGEEIDRRILARPAVRPVSVTDLVDLRPAYHHAVHPLPIPPERRSRVEEGREQHERTERLLAEPLHREMRFSRDGYRRTTGHLRRPSHGDQVDGGLPLVDRLADSRPQYIDHLAMYCALVERPEGRLDRSCAPLRGRRPRRSWSTGVFATSRGSGGSCGAGPTH